MQFSGRRVLPTKYFAFDFAFLMDNAGTCPGCQSPVDIVWQQAELFSNDTSTPVTVSCLDPGSS